jgi:hypothetical protein
MGHDIFDFGSARGMMMSHHGSHFAHICAKESRIHIFYLYSALSVCVHAPQQHLKHLKCISRCAG